jgi:hypothetical protein
MLADKSEATVLKCTEPLRIWICFVSTITIEKTEKLLNIEATTKQMRYIFYSSLLKV